MTSLALAQVLESAIPQTELVVIPGGSHMFMLEDAEATADALETWLDRVL